MCLSQKYPTGDREADGISDTPGELVKLFESGLEVFGIGKIVGYVEAFGFDNVEAVFSAESLVRLLKPNPNALRSNAQAGMFSGKPIGQAVSSFSFTLQAG